MSEDRDIDLRDRLRFAADALAADFGDALSADHAAALVFSSAEGLLASASVTEFVPILAERRARLAARAGTAPTAPVQAPAPSPPVSVAPPPPAPVSVDAPPPPAPPPPPPAPSPAVSSPAGRREPLLAVPGEELARLRSGVEQLKGRLTDWQAGLTRR